MVVIGGQGPSLSCTWSRRASAQPEVEGKEYLSKCAIYCTLETPGKLLGSKVGAHGTGDRARCASNIYLHGPQHTPARRCRSLQEHRCKPSPSCKQPAWTSTEPCQAPIGSSLHAEWLQQLPDVDGCCSTSLAGR